MTHDDLQIWCEYMLIESERFGIEAARIDNEVMRGCESNRTRNARRPLCRTWTGCPMMRSATRCGGGSRTPTTARLTFNNRGQL